MEAGPPVSNSSKSGSPALAGALVLGVSAAALAFSVVTALLGWSGAISAPGNFLSGAYGFAAFLVPVYLFWAALILADPQYNPDRIFMLACMVVPFLTLAAGMAVSRDPSSIFDSFPAFSFLGHEGTLVVTITLTLMEILTINLAAKALFRRGPAATNGGRETGIHGGYEVREARVEKPETVSRASGGSLRLLPPPRLFSTDVRGDEPARDGRPRESSLRDSSLRDVSLRDGRERDAYLGSAASTSGRDRAESAVLPEMRELGSVRFEKEQNAAKGSRNTAPTLPLAAAVLDSTETATGAAAFGFAPKALFEQAAVELAGLPLEAVETATATASTLQSDLEGYFLTPEDTGIGVRRGSQAVGGMQPQPRMVPPGEATAAPPVTTDAEAEVVDLTGLFVTGTGNHAQLEELDGDGTGSGTESIARVLPLINDDFADEVVAEGPETTIFTDGLVHVVDDGDDDLAKALSEAEAEAEAKSRAAAEAAAAKAAEGTQHVPGLGKRRKGPYGIPVDGILTQYPDGQYWVIDQATRDAAVILKETLEEFNIQAEVTGIRKGPVITMFEILPAPGVKLSKIVNLQDNIALRLAASSVRIVAPIPGKHAVGIEVPNRKRNIVSFREMIEGELHKDGKKHEIPVILGKDITGEAQTLDLVQTPHLLIAGSTGSGKSVCVNSMILSILYQKSPAEVRLILIDPKIVELKLYNDIPHLLTPVITEPKRAFQALQYCIFEMERRYALLDSMGVRDIRSYNKRIKERNIATEHLPYIVVVIDEFADLMATTGKELESTVARLAAMSRAVGIHLVLATQRPSIDVITGLIKANIPSRIAFMVASKMDSRIIIDMVGAEKLLGRGDMLFASAWDPFPIRMQGAFVSEEEVEKVVEYVKTLGEPDYIDEEIFYDDDDQESSPSLFSEGDDPMYDKALEIVMQQGKASASYIQRRLKIGYNRAARIVEEMEERGIVGPSQGSKPRDLLRAP